MEEESRKYRVFLSAAEASGDGHCAGLVEALKKVDADIECVGVGGHRMEAAGCKLLENTIENAAMIYNAFKQGVRYWGFIRKVKRYFKTHRVDLVVVCDSPAFNFHIAKAAKKAGVKTLFYVAPQLWAWAPWRIKKLHKWCDRLACILPFEQEWFQSKAVDTMFVGNPMLDTLDDKLSKNKKNYSKFDTGEMKIALMPGSREAEIDSLWRPMQEIAAKLRRKYGNVSLVTVAADARKMEILKGQHTIGFRSDYVINSVYSAAKDADFTIAASGSATLQVAAAGCPMVIMYQSNKLIWHLLGRWLITMRFLSLVNILANRELVPEYMPYFDSIEPITETIQHLLEDTAALARTSEQLIDLAESLRKEKAADNVAKIVTEMLSQTD